MSNTVASFYQFIGIPHPPALRNAMLPFCESRGLRGTVLLAPEGINATLAGAEAGIGEMIAALRNGSLGAPGFDRLELKLSAADAAHFDRLKIKCKAEIITFGTRLDAAAQVGKYVAPRDWNALLDEPDTLVIDTRNAFEIALGSFPGALDPGLTRFSQFPGYVAAHLDPAKQKKIAMFCTGGIRCEKASAHMLAAGFAEVYHLQGGILRYLAEIAAPQSRWRGNCFVFDQRVALAHGLKLASNITVPENPPGPRRLSSEIRLTRRAEP